MTPLTWKRQPDGRWTSGDYTVKLQCRTPRQWWAYSGKRDGVLLGPLGFGDSVGDAKAACQRHSDKTKAVTP